MAGTHLTDLAAGIRAGNRVRSTIAEASLVRLSRGDQTAEVGLIGTAGDRDQSAPNTREAHMLTWRLDEQVAAACVTATARSARNKSVLAACILRHWGCYLVSGEPGMRE